MGSTADNQFAALAAEIRAEIEARIEEERGNIGAEIANEGAFFDGDAEPAGESDSHSDIVQDENVSISAADATFGYLEDKVYSSDSTVTISTDDVGSGVLKLDLQVTPRGPDGDGSSGWAALQYSYQGYQAPAQKDTLNMTIVPGTIYIAGVKVTPSAAVPATQSITGSDTRFNYLTVNLAASTAAYTGDASADPGNGNDTTEYIVLHEVMADAASLTKIITRQCGDIHITRTA